MNPGRAAAGGAIAAILVSAAAVTASGLEAPARLRRVLACAFAGGVVGGAFGLAWPRPPSAPPDAPLPETTVERKGKGS